MPTTTATEQQFLFLFYGTLRTGKPNFNRLLEGKVGSKRLIRLPFLRMHEGPGLGVIAS